MADVILDPANDAVLCYIIARYGILSRLGRFKANISIPDARAVFIPIKMPPLPKQKVNAVCDIYSKGAVYFFIAGMLQNRLFCHLLFACISTTMK